MLNNHRSVKGPKGSKGSKKSNDDDIDQYVIFGCQTLAYSEFGNTF